jgi:hypothetical protein
MIQSSMQIRYFIRDFLSSFQLQQIRRDSYRLLYMISKISSKPKIFLALMKHSSYSMKMQIFLRNLMQRIFCEILTLSLMISNRYFLMNFREFQTSLSEVSQILRASQ